FDLLLAKLDSDREKAAQIYERLYTALLIYFEHNGSLAPAELVDDTFDRAAHNLLNGKEIYVSDPGSYFYGIAHNVLREWRRNHETKFLPMDNPGYSPLNQKESYELFRREQERTEHQKRVDCMEKCLASLPKDGRELIIQYYDGEKIVKINNRKSLAERLG